MKGLFPHVCKPIGYALLILSVFIPLLLSMFGLVHDKSLLLIKLGMKLSIWVSLFMIFLSRTKDESEETANFRSKAMKFALYFGESVMCFCSSKHFSTGTSIWQTIPSVSFIWF